MRGKRLWGRTAIAVVLSAVILYGSLAGIRWLQSDWRGEKPEISVIIKTIDPSIEFWQVLQDGIEAAAKEFDVNVTVTGPQHESDVDDQISIVNSVIQRKPSAIVMAATDYYRLAPAVEAAKAKGIKVISVDSRVHSNAALSFIATDNLEAGRKAGELLAGLMPSGAKAAVISFVEGTATQMEREAGARESLEAGGIEVVGTYHTGGKVGVAYQITKQLLAERPDIGGIVALNEPTSIGAGRAIREAGRAGDIKLIGFDTSIDEVKLLEEGVMQATVVQRPFNMGYLGIKTVMEALRGERVPGIIDTGSVVITKSNMYTEENQKLLFPFVGE